MTSGWINKVFDQFLEDFKADRGSTVSLRAAINDLKSGKIDPELLKTKVKLAKAPEDYTVNSPNKEIGMLLGAKAGHVIWYFKTDKDVSINPEEIGNSKYKEILMADVLPNVTMSPHLFKKVAVPGICVE